MVYTGKPSRACATCKKRRIKCDEARPACGQCIKSKRECTGYKSEADLLFRDETSATARRAARSRKGRLDVAAGGKPSSDDDNDDDEAEDAGAKVVRQSSSLSSSSSSANPVTGISRAMPAQHLEIAKAYFFRQYILPRESHGHDQFKLLTDMYRSCDAGDAISRTTEAISLMTLSRHPMHKFLRPEASRAYGAAISSVNRAVSDPALLRRNDTLMSVLLLSFAETIDVASPGGKIRHQPIYDCPPGEIDIRRLHGAWAAHTSGAQSIVRLRGADEMAQSQESLLLLMQIRFQLIIKHIFSCTPVPDIEDYYQPSLEQSTIITFFEPQTVLAGLGLRIPDLRYRALHCLRTPMSPGLGEVMLQLLADTKNLDDEMLEWVYRTRNARPERIAGYYTPEVVADITEEKALPGPVFTYDSLSGMNTWNSYRFMRLTIQLLMWNIYERLLPPEELFSNTQSAACIDTIRDLAAGICSSVPYALGYLHALPLTPPEPFVVDVESGDPFVMEADIRPQFIRDFLGGGGEEQYDELSSSGGSGGSKDTTAAGAGAGDSSNFYVPRMQGPAISAWYQIWPLHYAQCAQPVDLWVKDWIKGRYRYIEQVFGIAMAEMYQMRVYSEYVPGAPGRAFTPYDFAPPPWEPVQ